MDINSWINRWKNNEIGFHLDDANPHLTHYWSSLSLRPGDHVLVPLCGMSIDMLWLRDQSLSVTGVEVSPVAVSRFFQALGVEPQEEQIGDFRVYRSGDIRIFEGDFFALKPEMLPQINAIYDRAALVALNETDRQRYVRHITALTPPGCEIFLVTTDYRQQEMDGPPFAVVPREVETLYGVHYQITELLGEEVMEISQRFRDRGLKRLYERVYKLVRKSPT